MKRYILISLSFLLFCAACSKKQDVQEEVYSSAYKVVSVANGGAIKGMIKTDPNHKFQKSIETQKDQDVCGTSHPNQGAPNADGSLPNCIIGLEQITAGKDFSKRNYTLDQKGCEFIPYIQIVPIGASMVVSNNDKTLHNYHISLNGETVKNEAQPEGAPPREVILKQKGLNSITCDVHPWMKGYIWMADHPYYTLSDSAGMYSLTDVPPGTYKLVLWRDNWNVDEIKNKDGVIESYKWGKDFSKEQEVTVEAGKDVVVDFTLP